jgi:Protein of unknown function (DUF3987)
VPDEQDWIEAFLEHSEGLPTPPLFRLWSAVGALASVLERRVWLPTARQVLFPNLFTLLVGPPGSGKSVAIRPVRNALVRARVSNLAPTDMTKASLVDVFAGSQKKMLWEGQTTEYHPLSIVLSEFGTLVSAYDLELMSTINTAFDNEDISSQRRGHNDGKAISIRNANLNILAGTQPGYLSELLPETAWSMGFAARLLMIYCPEAPRVDMFDAGEDGSAAFAALVRGLVGRARLVGPFAISEEAKTLLRLWASAGMPPVPEHSRLAHYRSRRAQYVLKLSMLAAVARAPALHITAADAERARGWLLAAESAMPDIFRDMAQKSDVVLMNELHRYAFKTWVDSARDVTRRAPLHKSELMRFLALRAPAPAAEKVLDLMVQADWFVLDRNNPMLYVPRPRGFGVDG